MPLEKKINKKYKNETRFNNTFCIYQINERLIVKESVNKFCKESSIIKLQTEIQSKRMFLRCSNIFYKILKWVNRMKAQRFINVFSKILLLAHKRYKNKIADKEIKHVYQFE